MHFHGQYEMFTDLVLIRAPLTAYDAIITQDLTPKAIALRKGHVTGPTVHAQRSANRHRGSLVA